MPDGREPSACIDKWRRQLLDISGRNRMLYYRPSRATLTIHCGETQVWSDLVGEGAIDLDPTVLALANGDDAATTRRLEDAHKRIKSLSEVARTFSDEQGVHVMYALFGWLNWVDESRPPGPGDETVRLHGGRQARRARSPLLFVPVTLERTHSSTRAKLEENAATETNLALQVLLKQQIGLEVEFDPEADLSPELVVDTWRAAVRTREQWSVEHAAEVLIDSFSFKKIALLRQLERSVERVTKQPVLQALCGDADPLLDAPAVPSFENLDKAVSDADLKLVVAADASQLKALLAVEKGVNAVIQGPPGTGKSQTITNIISTTIANGKRVLFIAEKRPARDIVVENLSKAGLGDAILHITEEVLGRRGSSQAKRDIVDQLADILEQGPGKYVTEGASKADYERVVAVLNKYATTLHARLGHGAWSTPFRLMAAWAGERQSLARDTTTKVPSVRDVTEEWRERAFECASRLDDLGEEVLSSSKGPWLEAEIRSWDSASESRLAARLAVLEPAPQVIDELMEVHRGLHEPSVPWTLAAIEEIAAHLTAVGMHGVVKGRPLSIINPTFWRTKRAYAGFRSAGGTNAELAGRTAAALKQQLANIREAATALGEVFPNRLQSESLSDLARFAGGLLRSIRTVEPATQVRARCLAARELALDELLLELVRTREAGQSVRDILQATLLKHWALEASKSDPSLATEGPAIIREIERMRAHEARSLRNARAEVLNAIAPFSSSSMEVAPRESELGTLRSQIHAKRRKPLRWLFTKAANLILEMKPCVVASPLAVAQFLESDAYEFDLVVFDEASQVPTADAVVPISRARQVVIVGDSQQMPPTSFFDKAVTLETDDYDEVIYESILQDCDTLLPSLPLLWHYRSLDERLIAFSNRSFYGGKLLTFPSAWLDHPELGVKFVHLPSAVYGRGGSHANPDEANQVVEILKQELHGHPEHEIGVTAMSIAQAAEVQARIEQAASASTEIRAWIERGGRSRNLETVQGDEFDVSILSFGYGRDASGNLQLNFGPLSREDGYKRLNVAITRARKKMIVVSSIRGADIPTQRVGEGGQRVRQFLEYAERGPSALDAMAVPTPGAVDVFESPLEEEVAREIRALGWSVETQVGVNRFRVDIGIKHPKYPGRYLAGVECDGATYHNGETARDRDIGRQQVLEKLGWRIFRVWSPDWCREKNRVLRELQAFLARLLDDGPDGGIETPGPSPEPPGHDQLGNPIPVFQRSEPALRAGTVPYRLEGPERPPTSPSDVAAWTHWLTEKLRQEGPWNAEELALIAHGHLAINRIVLVTAARRAVSEGQVKTKGSSYWATETDHRLVPVKVSIGDLRRDFSFYSDEEILRAFELACADVGGVPTTELARFTARFLGFPRCTSEIKSRLEKLIPYAAERVYIKKAADDTWQPGDHCKQYTSLPMKAPYSLPVSPAPPESAQRLPSPGRVPSRVLSPSKAPTSATSNPVRLSVRSLIALAHQERKSITILYQASTGQVTNRVVDVLGFRGNYFDAFDHLRFEQRTFRLDRILKAEWTDRTFTPTKSYSPSEWVRRRR